MDRYKIQHNPTFHYPYRLYEEMHPRTWVEVGDYATLIGAKRDMLLRECAAIERKFVTFSPKS